MEYKTISKKLFSRILVFWSKVGDNPERILMTEVCKKYDRIYGILMAVDPS